MTNQNKESKTRPMALTVKSVIVNNKKEVLLLKRSKDSLNPGKWDLPGGHLEEDETIEESIKREISEETGIEIEVGEIINAVEFDKGMKQFQEEKRGLRYICYHKSGDVEISDEHEDFAWLPIDEAIEKLSDEDGFEKEKKETLKKAKEVVELKESLSGWRRALADLENFKKRTQKANEEFRQYCLEDFVLELLPIVDNFDLALDHVPEENQDSDWLTGILHIRKQLTGVLESKGVTEIPAKPGDKVDENVHDVIVGEAKKGKIKKVIKKGYKMNERVIRAVSVEVE